MAGPWIHRNSDQHHQEPTPQPAHQPLSAPNIQIAEHAPELGYRLPRACVSMVGRLHIRRASSGLWFGVWPRRPARRSSQAGVWISGPSSPCLPILERRSVFLHYAQSRADSVPVHCFSHHRLDARLLSGPIPQATVVGNRPADRFLDSFPFSARAVLSPSTPPRPSTLDTSGKAQHPSVAPASCRVGQPPSLGTHHSTLLLATTVDATPLVLVITHK